MLNLIAYNLIRIPNWWRRSPRSQQANTP